MANMLESPLAISAESSPVRYIGFDLQPTRIKVGSFNLARNCLSLKKGMRSCK